MIKEHIKEQASYDCKIDKFLFNFKEGPLLVFSNKLEDMYFLYNNLKEEVKLKSENYKLLNQGKIPPLFTRSTLLTSTNTKAHFLDYKNTSEYFFEKFNILDFILNDSSSISLTCPKCKNSLTKHDYKDLSKELFLLFENKNVVIGENIKQSTKINAKELLKKGIFNIIYNNKLLDVDDIKDTNISNYLLSDEKFCLNNLKEFEDKLGKYVKNGKNDIFIFVINSDYKNERLNTFSLETSYICQACKEVFKDPYKETDDSFLNLASLKSDIINNTCKLNEIFFDGISLYDLFTTPFNKLAQKVKNIKIKNLIDDLISYELEDFCFLSKIDNVNISFLLNFILIKNNVKDSDIVFIQNPLSFLNIKDFNEVINDLKHALIIVFENCEDILSCSFNKIYNLTNSKEETLNLTFENESIKKNTVNITQFKINKKQTYDLSCFKKVTVINPVFYQSTILANALNIFNDINNIFLQTTDAKILGLTKKDFLLKSTNSHLCKTCLGKGRVKNNFDNNFNVCQKCEGYIFDGTILNLRFKNITYKDMLNFNIKEAKDFFSSFLKISKPLNFLYDFLFDMEIKDYTLRTNQDYLTSDIINVINIASNFNKLQDNSLYIIKNAFSFLSNFQKLRLLDTLKKYLKDGTIILEAI